MAAPVLSVTPSRTSGLLPLGVSFDATGTTDGDVNSFRGLIYLWNFGDSSSGNWDFGCLQGAKNFGTGPVAAHVYREAGTYTWTCVVWDGTTADVETGTITVTDWPDDANTVCIGNVLPVNGVNGVPSNATVAASADFDAMIAAHMGTNKRLLFNNADTFVSSAAANVSSAGPNMIGGYGAGAGFQITSTDVVGVVNINNVAVDDIRIVGAEIIGNGATDVGVGIRVTASIAGLTILDSTVRAIGYPVVATGTSTITGGFIQECTINDYYNNGSNAFFGRILSGGVMGCDLGPQGGGGSEHVLRVQKWNKLVVSNNTMTGAADSDKTVMTLRADVHSTDADNSRYGVVWGNRFYGGSGAYTSQIGPSSESEDARISDALVFSNYSTAGATTQTGWFITADRVTLRNNVVDTSGGVGHQGFTITNSNVNATVTTDDNLIESNTIYSDDTDNNFRAVFLNGATNAVTNTVIRNNLAYAPDDSVHALLTEADTVTGTIGGSGTQGNSSDAQIGATDPLFVGPLTSPIGFTISAASYGADGGTASFPAQQSDFFNARDKSGDNRIGAVVQDGEQQIKGVAA